MRGQDAKRLSEHYLLECDYGTSILTVYNEGDPVFLCESHLSAIPPRDNCIAGVRPLEARLDAKDEGGTPAVGAVGKEAEQLTLIAAAVAGATEDTSTIARPVSDGADAPNGPIREALESVSSMPATDVEPAPPAAVVSFEIGATPAMAPSADASMPSQAKEIAQDTPADATKPVVAVVESASAVRGVAARTKRETSPASRTPVRDLAFGNAAKALVDETIWNMAPGDLDAYRNALARGRGEMEAAQAAGGQIAIIHRKIADYTAKIEPMLSASKASISVGFAIDKPLEQAILEIIGGQAMTEAEKDAAVAQLGAVQEQIKNGLQRDIAPLEAHRMAREIGERCHWGADSTLNEEVKSAYRAIYTRLREALRAFVPEARELDERLANLYAAKSDLESAISAKAVRSAAI